MNKFWWQTLASLLRQGLLEGVVKSLTIEELKLACIEVNKQVSKQASTYPRNTSIFEVGSSLHPLE